MNKLLLMSFLFLSLSAQADDLKVGESGAICSIGNSIAEAETKLDSLLAHPEAKVIVMQAIGSTTVGVIVNPPFQASEPKLTFYCNSGENYVVSYFQYCMTVTKK